jgi:hypothetical protein
MPRNPLVAITHPLPIAGHPDITRRRRHADHFFAQRRRRHHDHAPGVMPLIRNDDAGAHDAGHDDAGDPTEIVRRHVCTRLANAMNLNAPVEDRLTASARKRRSKDSAWCADWKPRTTVSGALDGLARSRPIVTGRMSRVRTFWKRIDPRRVSTRVFPDSKGAHPLRGLIRA